MACCGGGVATEEPLGVVVGGFFGIGCMVGGIFLAIHTHEIRYDDVAGVPTLCFFDNACLDCIVVISETPFFCLSGKRRF